jgi:hypothetical protein
VLHYFFTKASPNVLIIPHLSFPHIVLEFSLRNRRPAKLEYGPSSLAISIDAVTAAKYGFKNFLIQFFGFITCKANM